MNKFSTKLKKVLCFGDSLTEGWIEGGAKFHPFTTILSQLLNHRTKCYEVINAGLSGETVCEGMVQRLPQLLEQHEENPFDIVVLQGGTNDILQFANVSHFGFISHFESLVDMVRRHGASCVCVLTIMEGWFVPEDGAVSSHEESDKLRREFNKDIQDMIVKRFGPGSGESGVVLCPIDKLLPMFALTKEEKDELWDDFLHPSVKGYEKMGAIVHEYINSQN